MTSAASERGEAAAAALGPERIPPLGAQLGMTGAVSERAPQKYLIQNQIGIRLFYWADTVSQRPLRPIYVLMYSWSAMG